LNFEGPKDKSSPFTVVSEIWIKRAVDEKQTSMQNSAVLSGAQRNMAPLE